PDLASLPAGPPAPAQLQIPAVEASAAAPFAGDQLFNSVKERVLALVVEKTGYPKDMLDLDLDLEADLGVDTVKQAEMFAAIREIYSIPRDENRKLRDYPTLAHVIRFVYEKRPDLAVAIPSSITALSPAPAMKDETSSPPRTEIATSETDDDTVDERILALV